MRQLRSFTYESMVRGEGVGMNKMHNGRVHFEPVEAVADVGVPLQGYASNQATLAASGIASENR